MTEQEYLARLNSEIVPSEEELDSQNNAVLHRLLDHLNVKTLGDMDRLCGATSKKLRTMQEEIATKAINDYNAGLYERVEDMPLYKEGNTIRNVPDELVSWMRLQLWFLNHREKMESESNLNTQTTKASKRKTATKREIARLMDEFANKVREASTEDEKTQIQDKYYVTLFEWLGIDTHDRDCIESLIDYLDEETETLDSQLAACEEEQKNILREAGATEAQITWQMFDYVELTRRQYKKIMKIQKQIDQIESRQEFDDGARDSMYRLRKSRFDYN